MQIIAKSGMSFNSNLRGRSLTCFHGRELANFNSMSLLILNFGLFHLRDE